MSLLNENRMEIVAEKLLNVYKRKRTKNLRPGNIPIELVKEPLKS